MSATKSTLSVMDRFAQEYQEYHGMTMERRKAQLTQINLFSRFAGKSILDCDEQDFRSYLAMLVTDGNHVNTVRKKGNMIRPFFSWAFEADLIDGTRLMKIRGVRNPAGATADSEPRPYSAKELKQFWKDLNSRWKKANPKWWKHWRSGRSKYKKVGYEVMRIQLEAIVALALDSGMRSIEIWSSTIDHVHPDNAYIVIPQRGKRRNGKDRSREVPFTKEARRAVRAWLEIRAELKPGHDKLWLSAVPNQAEGGWLKPMTLKRFRDLMRTIGPYELHRFRHTCATNWLRAGMDLDKVQKLLGHATIEQTQAYAQIVREDVQKQVEINEARFEQMTHRPKRKDT